MSAKQRKPLPDVPSTDPWVGPFLQNPGIDRMTIAWIRRNNEACELLYGIEEAEKRIMVQPSRRIEGSSDWFYEVSLTDLMPDTLYAYTLACPGGNISACFRTFPENPKDITFICYGDNKSDFATHARVAEKFERHNPAFIMHSGDMTERGTYEEYRPYFFYPLRHVIDRYPLFPARGNHERDGRAYRQVFCLPRGETWYSFDAGPVHALVVDTTGWRHDWEKDDISRMYDWVEADLCRSQAPWKIVMQHEPSYDLGHRKDDWGWDDFLPVFRKYGVDLTLAAHAHGYQRLYPMFTPGENDNNPITHVISAGAGGGISSKALDKSDFLAAEARRYNYVVFSVSEEDLSAQVFSDDDDLLDSFSLSKIGGKYHPDILASALDEAEYP